LEGEWNREIGSDQPKVNHSKATGYPPGIEQCVYVEGGKQLAMRRMVAGVESEKIAQELNDLAARNDDELKERWRSLYATTPPQKIHRSLLIAAVAHRMQEHALGALKSSVRRSLMQAVNNQATPRLLPHSPSLRPRAGTVLVRDWGGVTHQARVLEDGILFRSKRYKSLSEVARVITGTRWSGPLFFGLRSAKEQNHRTR
jgi:hypothetical protein